MSFWFNKKKNQLLHIILPLNWRRISPCSLYVCWLNENPNPQKKKKKKKIRLGLISKLRKKSPKFHLGIGPNFGPLEHPKTSLPDNSEDCKSLHFVPSPFCRCGVFESRNHFFFTCPLYSLDRLRYLPTNLDNLTSNDLLFGCENQSDE